MQGEPNPWGEFLRVSWAPALCTHDGMPPARRADPVKETPIKGAGGSHLVIGHLELRRRE
jgi:hypothetical protein